jgi:hypothetical protein
VRIQTGAIEPVELLIVGRNGKPLPGLTDLKLRIRRLSDDWFFDWSDNTLKASSTQLYQTLQAVNASLAPGEYRLNTAPHLKGFNTGAIANPTADDTYRLTVIQDPGTNAANVPWIGEIKEGSWVDYFDQAISDNATPAEVRAELVGFGLDHLVSVNPGAAPPATGTFIKQILDKLNALASGGSQYWVEQSYSYNPGNDRVTGQVWVESNNLVSTAGTSCTVTWYDENGTALFSMTDSAPDGQGVFRVIKDNPGLSLNASYYAIAVVQVTGYGPVASAKGAFTIG